MTLLIYLLKKEKKFKMKEKSKTQLRNLDIPENILTNSQFLWRRWYQNKIQDSNIKLYKPREESSGGGDSDRTLTEEKEADTEQANEAEKGLTDASASAAAAAADGDQEKNPSIHKKKVSQGDLQ